MSFEILRLGHLGDGIAEGPVFVPRTLPNEIVDGEVRDGVLAAPRIITPSEHRVKAPCRHYNSCGGCSLQHADEGFVASWKAGVVQMALAAQGINADIRAIETSPSHARRRAKLSGRRTKKGAIVGFHGRGSDTLTPVPDCAVLTPAIIAILPLLETLTVQIASRKSEVSYTVTAADAGLDLAVDGAKEMTDTLRFEMAQFAQDAKLARLSWNGELLLTLTPPTQQFGDVNVTPPAGAFLQATKHGEVRLLSAVEEATKGAKAILDLFAGCGTFALPLARRAPVHAIEAVPDMMEALDAGWRMSQGLKKVTTETRDLYRRPLDADELAPFDAAVIDPPRAGAEAQVQHFIGSNVAQIAFVSCNPVTFARDAKVLTDGGYRLNWVTVIDQFRWSPHVELAASFTRTDMSV
ncbi:MAG: class I SAM-dependent RNA methyltransferase [Pseudomonadota bacterium]